MKNARVWSYVGTAGTTTVVELLNGKFALVDRRTIDSMPQQVWQNVQKGKLQPSDLGWLDVGIFLGTIDAQGFNDARKVNVNMKQSFQELYDSLTQGEKVHMANKLYKDDGIAPAKLRASIWTPKFQQGDTVQVSREDASINELELGDIVVILAVDVGDPKRPYRVLSNGHFHTRQWASEDQLKKVDNHA